MSQDKTELLPNQMGVHELCTNGSQDLVLAVLHQRKFSRIEDHTHLEEKGKCIKCFMKTYSILTKLVFQIVPN